ncbi:hypothetical protein D7S86_13015 [Pararobbsia silviterrae]|uniref:Uncharacterized protein n=1 Tax=Pararobbsia silviterrae TaxID=1792498 RepID=A0A494XVI6_9BURK|nr:hypothetical protein D7S86_13015 [Pararobbsia silviterrae]
MHASTHVLVSVLARLDVSFGMPVSRTRPPFSSVVVNPSNHDAFNTVFDATRAHRPLDSARSALMWGA